MCGMCRGSSLRAGIGGRLALVWRLFGAPVISDCAEDAAVIESAYPKTL